MIWLIGLVTLVGSIVLNARHQRRLARINGQVRTISLPTGVIEFRKPLTRRQAEQFKAEWIKAYRRRP